MAVKSLSVPLAFFESAEWVGQGRGMRRFSEAAADLDLQQMVARGLPKPSVRALAKRWNWSLAVIQRWYARWNAQTAEPFKDTKKRGTQSGTKVERVSVDNDELAWRIAETWHTHLEARAWFFGRMNGVKPVPPVLTPDTRAAIRRAIQEHDAERMGPEDRERWRAESPVRAAGAGIFFSPWHTGTDEDGNGRRYLEPWRPWMRQKGKPDPVPGFAAAYFERKEAGRAKGGKRQPVQASRVHVEAPAEDAERRRRLVRDVE